MELQIVKRELHTKNENNEGANALFINFCLIIDSLFGIYNKQISKFKTYCITFATTKRIS
jgi:hypothetical protein